MPGIFMRASVFEFALLVDQQIEALSREEYVLRTGRAKHLLEELYPLSRFALSLKFPGSNVEVEAFENNNPVDGIVRFIGPHPSELLIEVTYVHSYEDALRRELMWKTGSAPGAGRIFRKKANGEVIACSDIETHIEEVNRLAASIVGLHAKKCAKQYPRGTMLLIAFEDPTFFGQEIWRELLAKVRKHSDLTGGCFSDVHIINCGTNEILSNANF